MLEDFLLFYATPFMAFLGAGLIIYAFFIARESSRPQSCPPSKVSKPKKAIQKAPYNPNKTVKNPFIVGQVVHYGQFFGREQIIQRLFNLWGDFPNNPMQNAAIYGEKRIGKTSLLFHLKDLAETAKDDPRWRKEQKLDYLPNMQDYQFVYVTFQNIECQTQQGFLQYILQEMELTEEVDITLPEVKPLIKFREILSSYLAKPTVILLDDAEIALKHYNEEFNTNFWHGLRAITNSQPFLAFVATSNENNLLELEQKQNLNKASPFFNLFIPMEIQPFSDIELESLLNLSPKSFESNDIKIIKSETKGHPAKIQILARERLNYLLNSNSSNDWKNTKVN